MNSELDQLQQELQAAQLSEARWGNLAGLIKQLNSPENLGLVEAVHDHWSKQVAAKEAVFQVKSEQATTKTATKPSKPSQKPSASAKEKPTTKPTVVGNKPLLNTKEVPTA